MDLVAEERLQREQNMVLFPGCVHPLLRGAAGKVGMNRAAQPDHAEQPVRGALGHGRACERLLSGTQCLRRDQV